MLKLTLFFAFVFAQVSLVEFDKRGFTKLEMETTSAFHGDWLTDEK